MVLEKYEKGGTGTAERLGDDDVDVVYIDEDDEVMDSDLEENDDSTDNITCLREIGEDFLNQFCKEASSLFFSEYGLVNHQISSYNDFINNGIQGLFDSIGEITVTPGFDPSKKGEGEWKYASVKFGKITLEPPCFWAGESTERGCLKLLPRHARLQNMTYGSQIKVETFVQVYIQKLVRSDKFKTGKEQYLQKDILSKDDREIKIGSIPVMVKSDLCWMSQNEQSDCEFDQGGYFIIKGAEKTLIAQEQPCLKRLWLSNTPLWSIGYRSELKRNRVYITLMKDPTVKKTEPRKVLVVNGKVLVVNFLSAQIPAWLLFFALGVSSDKEVVDLIDCDSEDGRVTDALYSSIYYLDGDDKKADFRKTGQSLKYISNLIKECAYPPDEPTEVCFKKYLFPGLNSFKKKAAFLGYMVKCLLQAYIGKRKCDNPDNFRNKRLDLAGELLSRELIVHIKHTQRRMVKVLQRDLNRNRDIRPMEHYIDASIITNGLSRAFSTGAWSHSYKFNERISGVVATLRRTNPLQTTADMRKIRQQVKDVGKVGEARYPHPSHWGKICFLSTPDGENSGLVKNLAVSGLVSTNIHASLLGKMYTSGMEKLSNNFSTLHSGKTKVLLNGDWVGVCENSSSLVSTLRSKRRKGKLPQQVEIKHDKQLNEIRIFSDAGRILRPLAVVSNLKKFKAFEGGKYSFQDFLDRGVIELTGIEEEEDCQVAWSIKYLLKEGHGDTGLKYTHCELDLSFLLALSCGIIPFCNHDHARRILYESEKHSQQAIGFSTTNPDIRVDTLTQQLYYPQIPLFHTFIADCLGKTVSQISKRVVPKPEIYNGQNAIVAVNVHLGYNQEDSLVMNRASLERGMFRSEHIRSYKAEVDNKELQEMRKSSRESVNFGKIESTIGRVHSLEDDGFPYIGANLQAGDIIIGKCTDSETDRSVKLRHSERGMVQKVVLSSNDDGKNFGVVSLRQVRSPCLGDKFASMHGQTGVIGFLESQENFPFTLQGIVPDIVINPHAFPSRQSPGQLLEAALGKGIACGGHVKYATPFSTPSVDDIQEQLHRAGFKRYGNERVYDGRTGETISTLIFMGPNFYQRLTHMAEDKVKFRNTGAVHPLTRQPVADRKRFGGVKFGEMERDCLIAHGAASTLYERLFTLSDASQMYVCRNCQNMVPVIQRSVPGRGKIRGPFCRICDSGEDVVKVNVPHGAKLLTQELFSMGISLKLETQLS